MKDSLRPARRTAWGLLALGLAGALLAPPLAPGAELPKASRALAERLAAAAPGELHTVWVFLRDKGARPEAGAAALRGTFSARAIERRARRGRHGLAPLEDAPLDAAYVAAVEARVLRLRQRSRWLNALSAVATSEQLRELAALPFVQRIDVVRGFRRGTPEPTSEAPARSLGQRAERTDYSLNYGSALGQLEQIGVPAIHERGLHGEGVLVAVFDAGFDNLAHEVFASMNILARHDFVNGDDDVGDGADRGRGSHGTATLSVLGGFRDGELIGPAFAAGFVLAKTEDTESETPVEEDNWAAAAEWAEALGVDVISSSLGYLDFDAGNPSYTWADMDGRTAITTRAAELAAARGVVVVNSAGNEGANAAHNTLIAPADGAHVIAAGAVTASGVRAGFSSVGPSADGRIKPDVAAQGVAVKVAGSLAGQYLLANGTSFSCPLTAGVAALLLQAHPEASLDEILARLRSTARNAAQPDNLLGYGIVDARAAVMSRTIPGAVAGATSFPSPRPARAAP